MKVFLMSLFALSLANAKPADISGLWKKTGNIEPLAMIDNILTANKDEIEALKAQKYICNKVDARHHCRKLTSKVVELPSEAINRMLLATTNQVFFEETRNTYALTHEADMIVEWEKEQVSKTSDSNYDLVIWRDLKDTLSRVILKNHGTNDRLEFLVLDTQKIGLNTNIRINNSRGWVEYWGVVEYLP